MACTYRCESCRLWLHAARFVRNSFVSVVALFYWCRGWRWGWRRCLSLDLRGFGLGCGFVPVEGAAQAFLEIDLRVVAEEIASLRDVCLGVADVAIARRIVLGLHGRAGDFGEQLDHRIQGNASADAYVENLAGCVGGFKGQQVRLD